MDEKKEPKEVKSYSLKPVNIAWLREQAFRESTPESIMTASSLLDRLIDEAREREAREEAKSPTEQPKRRKTDHRPAAARVVLAA